ncbi:sugar ABC transporter permease [Bacillaceae bacterium SIJ1]|uniref:carbohydrate ABC transporter permease n=1 Tax=Litoribacterium kuwaitense TaxID=1398745 RepID=UPI0013EBB445|nr:sugar ABC transporter permease [Litoribacterium kuwaitense]NGP46922.1 sugar ABC transporter permease [Litoribacterium kuwaitense]
MQKGTQRSWKKNEVWIGYLFLLPSVFLLISMGVYPLLRTVILSLYDATFASEGAQFIGFGNYAALLEDPWFWMALKNTWGFTIMTVLAETALGLGVALFLNVSFKGRRWMRAAVLIPWAVPTVVSARMWEWLLNAEYGLINYLLVQANIISENFNWLGNIDTALYATMVADVWKTTPFMALILLAGLQVISDEVYEAAAIDGATKLQAFLKITLPMLLPTLIMGVLLRSLDAFRVFDLIYVMTGGGPANSTEVLSTYAYKTIFSSSEVSEGAAISTTMALSVFVLAIVLILCLQLVNRRLGGGA